MATHNPISLHPANHRYFMFRGKPTVLVTSAEHYGAVLNLDFPFKPYLDELKRNGLNYTRIFTGAYCEVHGAFGIRDNTLAPAADKLICPWSRSTQSGYANGGNKYDLNRWDNAYFNRLHAFVKEAGVRGIVVEISLFCPYYDDNSWKLSPMNSVNNINGVGKATAHEVHTLKHADLTHCQEEMTRKIVTEMRSHDNLIYEICNEPYFGGVTLDWQKHIASVITDTERGYPRKHLIAQNIANGSEKVENPDPNISILNFHYAYPPTAVKENSMFKGVIGCDETGFQGQDDKVYRYDGWDFIMAGGALYNNLDYSFTVSTPDGTAKVEHPTPGSGGRRLRNSLSALKRFIDGFTFVKMAPDSSVTVLGSPSGITARTLSEPGRQYAIYVRGGKQVTLAIELPKAKYRMNWVNTLTGQSVRGVTVTHTGGSLELKSPGYVDDIALSIRR
ncbi:MAG: cellulase family glycosylhydrolase [Armatimonadota bacterium]